MFNEKKVNGMYIYFYTGVLFLKCAMKYIQNVRGDSKSKKCNSKKPKRHL